MLKFSNIALVGVGSL